MDRYYRNRIDRVVDYIQANLESELSVKQLSQIACFSEFHFSRIFKTEMGESVWQFIRRLRLEKAAELLALNTGVPVTEIALTCGFATPSSFAKSFKGHFKMSPTKWRQQCAAGESPTGCQAECRVSLVNGSPVWTFDNRDGTVRQVRIEELQPRKVAYIRYVGPYHGDDILFGNLYRQLFQWAIPRGHMDENTVKLHIYHDNPHITETRHLRVMVAIPIPDSAGVSDTVGITTLSGGKYAVCRFLLKTDEFVPAWEWMFAVWLPNYGYELDDREMLERYPGGKT
ncbi:MAG: AraC family transcriptional regulator [Desulfobacteraceae bacterium]|nr:AraC family transcriptional regulator [Desulfobacteraceae bacterium]